jgi:hypothetical protein
LTGSLGTAFSLTFFNKSLQLSLLDQFLDLSLQVVAVFCVVAVVSMKTAVLVPRPFQSRVIPYLHEDVVYESVERSEALEPLIKSPSTPILLPPVSVPLCFGPCLMGLRWTVCMISFPLLSGGLIAS